MPRSRARAFAKTSALLLGLFLVLAIAAIAVTRMPPRFGAQTATGTQEADIRLPLFDVDWRSEEGAAVFYFLRRGVIGGFADGMFRGREPVSRAEAAKIILQAGGFQITHLQNNGRFLDVAECEWYTPYIASIAARDIIQGYPPRHILFALRNPVNTAEFLKMLTLAFQLRENLPHSFTDIPKGAWYARYAGVAWQYNLFPHRVEFLQADQQLSRSEILIALFNLFTAKRPQGRPGSEWFAPVIPNLPVLPVTQLFRVGNFSVTPDSVLTPPHQLLVGITGDPVLRFRVEADETEDIDVTRLLFTASGSSVAALESLSLFRANDATPFARATREACGNDPPDPSVGESFCATLSTPLTVQKPVAIPGCPRGLTIIVRPTLRSVAAGAIPGSSFHISLSDDPAHPSLFARGRASRTPLPQESIRIARVIGNDNLVVTGKFSFVSTDMQSVSPVAGTTSLASLHFTAHPRSREPITLHGIIFTVSASNLSLQSEEFALFDPAAPTVKASCAVAAPTENQSGDNAADGKELTGALAVVCDSLDSSAVNMLFAPGEQRQFILEGNISQNNIDPSAPSSLHVSLDAFSQPANAFGPSSSHVRWAFGSTETFWIEHSETVLRSTPFNG